MKKCQQQCGNPATVYAVDPIPSGWGGYYCLNCKPTGWQILDYVSDGR